jgi:uncharacterized protein YjbI with pentapeptide repeats
MSRYNLAGSRFAILTDKNLFMFDNFSKQNIFSVNIEDSDLDKIIFFRDDLVAVNSQGIYYFHEGGTTNSFRVD